MDNIYSVDKEVLNRQPEIRIGDRIFKIDDRLSVFIRMNEELKNVEEMGEFVVILRNALGKKAADEIMDMELSYKVMERIAILVLAAIQGIGEEDAMARFQQKK